MKDIKPPAPVRLAIATALFLAAAKPAPAQQPVAPRPGWSPITCPEADRNAIERFDVVRVIDDIEDGVDRWTAHTGSQQAGAKLVSVADDRHDGQTAMRIDFEFGGEKRLEYVSIGPAEKQEIAQPGLGVGFWVKGDGTPLGLRIRIVDKTGEFHQPDLARLDFRDWHFVAVAFDTPGGHWGGDGNGRLDYPCTLHAIVADRPQRGFKGKGSFWLDQVALVRPRKTSADLKIQVRNSRFGNVYEPGETVRLRATGPADEIRWRVEDFWQRATAEGSGVGSDADIAFPLATQGWYACTIERLQAGRVAEGRVFRCAALSVRAHAPRNEFVGVCCHFRNNAYPLECMDLLRRYGITEFRDEVSWSALEQAHGEYAMPGYGAKYTARAAELGLEPLLIFDYSNRFYDEGGFPNSDEAIAGYAGYCAALTRMLAGKVRYFEVWNEWTGGCGMRDKPGAHTPEAYAAMIRQAYPAVKSVNPNTTIAGIGGDHSAHHFEQIKQMIRSGAAQAMDVLSVHSYRYPRTPEETDLVGEVRKVADMARAADATDRVWVTEIGWPTHTGPRGVDERTQARMIVRTMALLQSTDVVHKVHWYDFKNDGLKREYNEHNFGIVWHQTFNCAPKPAAVALAIFARATAGARPVRLQQDSDTYAAFYELPDGRQLAVAWHTDGTRAVTVTGRQGKPVSSMGHTMDPDAAGTLTTDPIYLTGRDLKLTFGE